MTEETQEEKEAQEWINIPELKGTRLGSLMMDLAELLAEKRDIEGRIEATRELIAPIAQLSPTAIRCTPALLQAHWIPAGKPGKKLDQKKLVLAGVTKAQLDAGTVDVAGKKAHLRIDQIDPPAVPISLEVPLEVPLQTPRRVEESVVA